jgi:glycerate kinase
LRKETVAFPGARIYTSGMKIVIATNAFKGTLTAPEATRLIAEGLRRASRNFTTACVPMADGGAGTVDAVVRARGGKYRSATVRGPLGEPVTVRYGIVDGGNTAVIEMAAASGISLLKPHQRNPLRTTTWGTGELILAAARAGAKKIIVGVGDSATVEGGAGMAQALGARLLDGKGREIAPGAAGLATLRKIGVPASSAIAEIKSRKIRVLVACDVDNPLTGKDGAARVYGGQKFAIWPPDSVIDELDAALARYSAIIMRDLGINLRNAKCTGTAGGLGAGLRAFLGAEFRNGVDLVADMTGLRERFRGCDLVVTGEGKLDSQTAYGKLPAGVARIAKSAGVPVIAIGGTADSDASTLLRKGISAYFVCRPAADINDIKADAGKRLMECAEQVGRLLCLG